ncbi:acyl carrier protein [Saccharopolyspora pogona]|uniref:acyl carrier protein n=1 Tax=Saccharopolyspora pogona TaxID=333966 RepID=UPI001CC232AD|nr:acyl carrier protein [Saccharopolyspora pogona]
MHRVPDRVEFLDRLPRTPIGKIDKELLRNQSATAASQTRQNNTHSTYSLTADQIRLDIAQVLDLPDEMLTDDAQLLDHGLDSLRLIKLVEG